ncbi:succinate dehydrogenase, cytochrome b556 subunit [Pusillimonas sp. ANT_WB101]|uniref:succinate dehydrogenase, cytochrome b556 subunit n=1 Tax=Pusillimonas sp. ANT_WB101 TaxID=2597356 RepID=UPI0011EE189C|nr:succinate dehydrogenase, cytochrome b556 subunit [Pusillimonas sp. ANT_WB101]KAA0911084.1 succinate dehydrogenase, cytochrome b556 subunit [Pusillimonas sp. ANT_WB101]
MSNTRPLSPHLGIYRWRVNMLQSTLHRLTGLFLCLGALLVAWGLIAAATGESAWHTFAWFCSSWFGVLLLILWTWSLLFHLCNGIQHLARDMGKNFGPPTRDRTRNPVYWATGWMVIGVSVLLTLVVWVALALQTGGSL